MHHPGAGFSNEPCTVYLAHRMGYRNAFDPARRASNVEKLAYGGSFS
jgi:hypothetical protein